MVCRCLAGVDGTGDGIEAVDDWGESGLWWVAVWPQAPDTVEQLDHLGSGRHTLRLLQLGGAYRPAADTLC